MPDSITRSGGWIAGGLFILLSALIIPYAGVQADEALFAMPLYESVGKQFEIRIHHHDLPLMMMSYLGTLKTLLYWRLLPLFGSSVWTVRVPMVLAGAVTVLIFFRLILLSRASSYSTTLAATLGAFLLATDPVFLLTNTFDWGPVALEHLLLVTGCYFLVAFSIAPPKHRSRVRNLALGFFLFGLALWNKAIFVWALSGVVIGALTVYWPQVRQNWSHRNAAIAAASFLLGALPFVLYNVRHSGATAGQNVHFETDRMPQKWIQVKNAANGNSLFGYIVEEEWKGPSKPALSLRGRAAVRVRQIFGIHRQSGFYYAFGVLLVLAPWWWPSRAARFSLIFLCVTWAMMAFTKDAGGSAHHVVLLWPFPLLFAAVTLSAIPWRWFAILSGTALVFMNLLVFNQYLVQFEQNGAAGNFTDALFPLTRELPENGRTIYVLDWGIQYNMELAHQGRIKMRYAGDPLISETPNPDEQIQIRAALSDPQGIFVGHVPEREVVPGIPEHLAQFAKVWGFSKESIQTIFDSNGRPVFEIFRYALDR